MRYRYGRHNMKRGVLQYGILLDPPVMNRCECGGMNKCVPRRVGIHQREIINAAGFIAGKRSSSNSLRVCRFFALVNVEISVTVQDIGEYVIIKQSAYGKRIAI